MQINSGTKWYPEVDTNSDVAAYEKHQASVEIVSCYLHKTKEKNLLSHTAQRHFWFENNRRDENL